MSHIVTIKTEVRDAAAVRAACIRLGLPAPVQGKAKLFSGEVEGLAISCPTGRIPSSATPPPARSNSTTTRVTGATRSTSTNFCKPMRARRPRPKRDAGATVLRSRRLRTAPSRLTIQVRRCRMTKIIEITITAKGETTVRPRVSPDQVAAMPASSSNRPSASGPMSSLPPSFIRPKGSNSNSVREAVK